MAVQIITDLGLHLDLELEHSQFHSRDGGDDDISTLRRNLFWSTNTIDTYVHCIPVEESFSQTNAWNRLWSAYSGRPSLMKRLIHNVQSPVPSRAYAWEYYTDEYNTMAFPRDFDARAAASVHVYLAKLMNILARVSEVLYAMHLFFRVARQINANILARYSGVPDNSSDIQAVVAQADADFQDWHNGLPATLHVDCSPTSTKIPLPAVIELQ
jgi:hypothetical protein